MKAGELTGQSQDWLGIFTATGMSWGPLVTYGAMILGFFFFIQVAIGARWLRGILQSRFMQYMGTISYSFYIWHWPVFGALKPLFHKLAEQYHPSFFVAWPPVLLATFGLAALISHISHVVLEKHVGRFLRRRVDPVSVPLPEPKR